MLIVRLFFVSEESFISLDCFAVEFFEVFVVVFDVFVAVVAFVEVSADFSYFKNFNIRSNSSTKQKNRFFGYGYSSEIIVDSVIRSFVQSNIISRLINQER